MDLTDPTRREQALQTEWLLTDGLGGYAMGTALGVNTRRYHGWLVAATTPPVGRIVALHSMIEQLVIPREDGSEEIVDLSTQLFISPGDEPILHPEGWRWLQSVDHQPGRSVTWTWRDDRFEVRRTISRSSEHPPERPEIRIGYEISSTTALALRVRPMTPMRDFHELTDADAASPACEAIRGGLSVPHPLGGLELHMPEDEWSFTDQAETWHGFAYPLDRQRGQAWVESVGSPGYLETARTEHRHSQYSVHASFAPTSDERSAPPPTAPTTFSRPDPSPGSSRSPGEVIRSNLVRAAEQFIVQRRDDGGQFRSIAAGYPWFADWGRDAMISIPGLLLCSQRYAEAASVLHTFARHLQFGLIPNRFDDGDGDPQYNSVDASLWFVHAVREWALATGGLDPLTGEKRALDKRLVDACRMVVNAYRAGTAFAIHMDDDGLIAAGHEQMQLTWMDAKRNGVVFTPRHGKAVEVNALWHNALRCLAELTDDCDESRELRALAETAAGSFRTAFWWEEEGCLRDVLHPDGSEGFVPDGKLRPNQIFAVSLPFSPLGVDQRRAVVEVTRRRFLTPFGLRTLDRADPDYRGRYAGDMMERDAAYHNGTVWPWLIGPYCESLLRVHADRHECRTEVRYVLAPLLGALKSGCVGQLAEIYDGDEPHEPHGCPAQAWSVAEVGRVLCKLGD